MDCETARQRVDEGESNARLAAHLEECAACRREAEFGRRVAAAVAGMPRRRAPEGLLARVMAEVRPRALRRPERRAPVLALRPWELGWLGALCLLLLALIPPSVMSGEWSALSGADMLRTPTLKPGHWLPATLPPSHAWEEALAALSHAIYQYGPVGSGTAATWLFGAVAFGLGFSLLLSWRAGTGSVSEVEDARA